ncbi:MAG: tryptophan--tRNA ligase [Candidatus Asgardarchaeia archaeon]
MNAENTGALEKSTDYERLMKEFGVEDIKPVLEKYDLDHHLIRRGFFFAHRDLDKILDLYKSGEEFAVVSGRGPSNKVHIGHMLIFNFVKWIQEKFGVEVYIPLSDDEKYVFGKVKDLEEAEFFAYDNALDIFSIGLDRKKTHFFISTHYPAIYKYSIILSRNLTFSTIRAVFGFKGETNPGAIFYPMVQSAHILLPTIEKGLPVLVPIAIDQDPYIRVVRDISGKMELFKPAAIHSKFLRGLDGRPMSASNPKTTIFLTEDESSIRKKVWNALTGGWKRAKDQRKYGGKPNVCVVFEWFSTYFLRSDEELKKVEMKCRNGERLCGQCKEELIRYLTNYIKEHRKRRKEGIKYLKDTFMHEVDENIITKIEEMDDESG